MPLPIRSFVVKLVLLCIGGLLLGSVVGWFLFRNPLSRSTANSQKATTEKVTPSSDLMDLYQKMRPEIHIKKISYSENPNIFPVLVRLPVGNYGYRFQFSAEGFDLFVGADEKLVNKPEIFDRLVSQLVLALVMQKVTDKPNSLETPQKGFLSEHYKYLDGITNSDQFRGFTLPDLRYE